MLSYLYSLDVSHDKISFIPVVYGFCNVFVDVSSLPPHWEIEFHIDLEKDAKAVVLPSRQMTPRASRFGVSSNRAFEERLHPEEYFEVRVPIVFATKADGH